MLIAVMYGVLNLIEIRDPVTKFTAAKISFGVIYLFIIVSACAFQHEKRNFCCKKILTTKRYFAVEQVFPRFNSPLSATKIMGKTVSLW